MFHQIHVVLVVEQLEKSWGIQQQVTWQDCSLDSSAYILSAIICFIQDGTPRLSAAIKIVKQVTTWCWHWSWIMVNYNHQGIYLHISCGKKNRGFFYRRYMSCKISVQGTCPKLKLTYGSFIETFYINCKVTGNVERKLVKKISV